MSRSTRPKLVAVALLASVAVVGCATPGAAVSDRQQACAQDVSISKVEVTVLAAPAGSTIHMEIQGDFFDMSETGVQYFPNVPGPLVVGSTYNLGENPLGFVDLGRCLDVVGSAGLVYQVTTSYVTDPATWLLYALGGEHPGHPPFAGQRAWRGHLPI